MTAGQELEVAHGANLVNPFTGEAVELGADTERLARTIQQLRELDDERKVLVKAISREVISRMDQNAKWTEHYAGFDVTSVAPGKWAYPGDKLKDVLEGLVAEGVITKEAALGAIEREVSYKAKKRGVDALMKLGGEVEKRLKSIRARIPDESRSVTIKRKSNVVEGS